MAHLDEYRVGRFVEDCPEEIAHLPSWLPWQLADRTAELLVQLRVEFTGDYLLEGEILRHRSAQIDPSAVVLGPAILGPNVSVGPHVVLRDGVFAGREARIGPSCEIKSSWIFAGTAIAHLNYVGNSVIGGDVNIEAGAVIANHFNERTDKRILVKGALMPHDTGVAKFGAMVGDGVRIGANAVLSPGTILEPGTIVGRLQLVDQNPTARLR